MSHIPHQRWTASRSSSDRLALPTGRSVQAMMKSTVRLRSMSSAARCRRPAGILTRFRWVARAMARPVDGANPRRLDSHHRQLLVKNAEGIIYSVRRIAVKQQNYAQRQHDIFPDQQPHPITLASALMHGHAPAPRVRGAEEVRESRSPVGSSFSAWSGAKFFQVEFTVFPSQRAPVSAGEEGPATLRFPPTMSLPMARPPFLSFCTAPRPGNLTLTFLFDNLKARRRRESRNFVPRRTGSIFVFVVLFINPHDSAASEELYVVTRRLTYPRHSCRFISPCEPECRSAPRHQPQTSQTIGCDEVIRRT